MEYIIKNNSLFICDKYGNTGIRISENVSNVNFSEEKKIFLITKINGDVELKDTNGNLRSKIFEGAVDARFNGDGFVVRTKDGRNRLVDKSGNKGAFL